MLESLIGVFHRYTYIFHGYSGISVIRVTVLGLIIANGFLLYVKKWQAS